MNILLIIYDNGSYASEFPLGMGYIAATLKKEGHKVTIYNQDVYHYPERHLKQYLDTNHFDMIGASFVAGYWQYSKMLSISKAVNESKYRDMLLYIIGGHGPAAEPKYFLEKSGADLVVIGEGERTILEVLKHPYWEKIKGIAFFNNDGDFYKTERRPLIKNLDSVPFPEWDLFPINHYVMSPFPNMKHADRTFPVLASRGCLFNCVFCFRLDEGHRVRSVNNVIEEIQQLHDKYNITYIAFYDELFMSSFKRVDEMCKGIIETGIDLRWCCDGRLNFARKDTLELMKKAGCVFINYGIESLDETVLKNINKHLTLKQIYDGIKNTLNVGISPGLNFIWGNPGDTKETLWKSIKFIIKHTDYSQFRTIRPVTPYPGCQLYDDAINKGLIKNVEDFYENKHQNSDLLTANFTNISDDEFYEELYEANRRLITNYYQHKIKESVAIAKKLYIDRDSNFRGYRHT